MSESWRPATAGDTLRRRSDPPAPPGAVLVLVHPGSCCGSADFNLGRRAARDGREVLANELDRWRGGIIVIDGDLSDELPDHPALDNAIRACLERARQAGLPARRIWGCDNAGPGSAGAVRTAVRHLRLDPALHAPALTGAWHDPSGRHGCVNAARDALDALGFKTEILPGAFELSEHDDADD